MDSQKIFCIGLSKTGTTTICKALEIIGYKSAHFIKVEDFHKYDVVGDSPVPILYKALDLEYPNAKFILTKRDKDKWLKSFLKHLEKWQSEKQIDIGNARSDVLVTRFYLYGTLDPNPEKLASGFERYHTEVEDYFAARPNDLLTMDITQGDGWEKLCGFLGCPIPSTEFPLSNTAQQVDEYLKRSERLHNRLANYFMYKIKRIQRKIEIIRKYGW